MDRLIEANCAVKLVIWKNLYESPLAGFGCSEKTRTRQEATKQFHDVSIVYDKNGRLRGRHGHRKYTDPWPVPDIASKLPKIAKATKVVNTPSIPNAATHPGIDSKYYSRKYSLICNPIISPVLPGRIKTKVENSEKGILLRKPTTLVPPPILESDDSFKAMANLISLRSIVIDDSQGKTYRFYGTHYPLLLEKSHGKDDGEKILNKRNVVLETPELLAERRRVELNRKMERMHGILRQLKEEMTDGVFTTELKKPFFDPRIWSWNKERYIQPPDSDEENN